MRLSVLILLMLACIQGNSQSRAGISFSAGRAFRTFSGPRAGDIIPEASKFGYTIGLNYEHKLKHRLWILTGVYFTEMGYKNPGPQPGKRTLFAPVQFETKYRFFQLGVPVLALYYFTTTDWRFFGMAGLGANYLLQVTQVTSPDPFFPESRVTEEFENKYYNRLTLMGHLGPGVERQYRKYTFRLYSLFSYSITNNYNKRTSARMHLYSLGMGFAILKNFGTAD